MLRYEDLRVRDRQTLDRDFFNRRFRLIAESLGQLGEDVAAVNSDTDRLVNLGLNRVNEVLGPLLEKVQAASENGFLVATSATSLTVAMDLETTLMVDQAYRDLFQPTPYILLSRLAEGTHGDWAILHVQAFDRDNGGLAFKVVQVNGDIGAGAHSDWVISATAGVSATVMQTAADAQAAVTLAEQAAADAAAAAAAAEAVLENGPVASVNGQTGAVSLGISDIPNLTTQLGSKADSNHGHAISAITNLQSTLDGKAASAHTHAISGVTGLQTALDGKAASSHTHAIANVTGLQTALDGKLSTAGGTITGDLTVNGGDLTSYASGVNANVWLHSAGGTGRQYALISTASGSFVLWDNTGAANRWAVGSDGGMYLYGALAMRDNEVVSPKLRDYALTVNERGAISGAQAIDLTAGNYVTATIAGATQFSVSNPPGSGIGGVFFLVLTNGGAGTITWMSGTKWQNGTAPTLTPSGVDLLAFSTHDGGATWRGVLIAKDCK